MSEEIKTKTMCVDMDSIMEKIENDRKSAKARSASLKERILAELKEDGIARVTIQYEGCGDSGSVESITAYNKEDKEVELKKEATVTIQSRRSVFKDGQWANITEDRLVDLNTALEELAYDALEGHHPGWEINEGAYGELVINVEKETATLEHNTRITDVEYSEHEL